MPTTSGSLRKLMAAAAAGLLMAGALAQDVRLVGTMTQRAILVVDQHPPRTVSVGASLHGVKLLDVSGSQATVLIQNEPVVLQLGQNPVRINAARQSLKLQAAPNGHFFAAGKINQQDVRFMVDTGASAIALGSAQARQLGIDYLKGKEVVVGTANGQTRGWLVTLRTVSVGDLVLHNVNAIVTPEAMPYVLLGNSFLSQFHMSRQADSMTIERSP